MSDLYAGRSASPMLIGKTAEPFDDKDSIFELKLDGERCLAYLDKNEATLVNRRGFTLLPRLPELADIHRQVGARCILDGEVITGIGGVKDFEGIRSRLASQGGVKAGLGARRFPASLVVFDILYVRDRAVSSLPLMERKQLLETTVSDSPQMNVARYIEGQGKAFYKLVLQQGLEGVVGKKRQSLYHPGKRTREWVKVKNLLEDDYVICGYIPARHVAMLVLGQYSRGGGLVYKGRVTLGLRTGDFGEIRGLPKAATWPFGTPPPLEPAEREKAVWLRPSLVCTVYFMSRTKEGLMRQPHYRRLRPDKAPAEAVVAEGMRDLL